MDSKCLSAHTAPTGLGYPPYINASLNADGTITVIVRADGYDDGRGYRVSGNDASITLSAADFKRFLGETVSELIIANAKCDDSTRAVIRKAITSAIDTDPADMPARTFVLPGPMAWDAGCNRYHEPVEERARKIYDGFVYDGVGDKPKWQPHGNSTRQDDARMLARAELRAENYVEELRTASGQCTSGDSFPAGNCEG